MPPSYHDLIETTPCLVCRLSGDGRVLAVNSYALDVTGYPADELLGKNWWDLLYPGEHRDQVDGLYRRFERGEVRDYEMRLVSRDGGTRIVRWNSLNVRDEGRLVEINGVGLDITQHRTSQEALLLHEARYRNLFNSIGDPIYIHERGGWIIEANDAASTRLGVDRETLLSMHLRDILAEGFTSGIERRIEEVHRHGSVSFESSLRTIDGAAVPIEVLSHSAVHAGRRCVLSVTRDISKRKAAEKREFDMLTSLIEAFGVSTEGRDPYTAGHQRRVARLACAIGEELELPPDEIDGIRVAGLLHDIGKMQIPADILVKPTRLSELEFALVRTHSTAAEQILRNIPFPWTIADAVVQHHERLDGSGYPAGLSGGEIGRMARILAVADTVEAMATHRPYRPAHPIERALDEIVAHRGTRYDADVVDACLRVIERDGFTLDDEA